MTFTNVTFSKMRIVCGGTYLVPKILYYTKHFPMSNNYSKQILFRDMLAHH